MLGLAWLLFCRLWQEFLSRSALLEQLSSQGYEISPLKPWPVLTLTCSQRPTARLRWSFRGVRYELREEQGWVVAEQP